MKHPLLPSLALAIGIAAFSMSAILVRWANAPGAVTGFWRMLTASIALAIPFAISVRHASVVPRHLLIAVFAGIFFALNLATWNMGALIGTAANVSLLGNTSVIWVPLAALVLFKRKLRRLFWFGLAIALTGIVLVLGQDLVEHPALGAGDMLALIAAVFYSVYLLAMERARQHLAVLTAWWISTVTGTLTLFILTILLDQSFTGYPPETYVLFVVMALVIQIGGFLSLNFSQGHLPAQLVSTTLLIQPVITAVIAVPLLGQSLGVVQMIGGVIVLIGIFVAHRSNVRR